MSNVINKKTGEYRKSVNTPLYSSNEDWVINPTEQEIIDYTPAPVEPTESELAEQELADIDLSIIDEFLDHVSNGVPLSTKAKDYANHRKTLRNKI